MAFRFGDEIDQEVDGGLVHFESDDERQGLCELIGDVWAVEELLNLIDETLVRNHLPELKQADEIRQEYRIHDLEVLLSLLLRFWEVQSTRIRLFRISSKNKKKLKALGYFDEFEGLNEGTSDVGGQIFLSGHLLDVDQHHGGRSEVGSGVRF